MALFLLLIAPSMYLDKIEVGANGFVHSGGLWFDPNFNKVDFHEVERLEIHAQEIKGRVNRIQYDLIVHYKSGADDTVPIGDLMRFALREIVEKAKQKGIVIDGEEFLKDIEQEYYTKRQM